MPHRGSEEYQDHFDEGVAARIAGAPRSSNPYKPGHAHGAWDDGWLSADQEM